MFQTSTGRDPLWIRKAEHDALVKGELPESLKVRLVRCHLEDTTRGKANFWHFQDLKKVDLRLENGRLIGEVHLETADGTRGFLASLLGFVEAREGKLTRFDLVAKGVYWGEGTYTRGAPKGKFPFAVAFSLASGTEEADRIPPQCARGWLEGYYRLMD
jgi:hypothetical protein